MLSASEDEQQLLNIVIRVCADQGMPAQVDEVIADALDGNFCGRLSRLCSWEGGCLLHQPMDPAKVAMLRAQLVAAAPAGSLADDATFNVLIFQIVEAAAYSYRKLKADEATAASPLTVPAHSSASGSLVRAGDADTEDERERKKCATCYDELAAMQGRTVDLPVRAHFVAQARSSAVAFGYTCLKSPPWEE